MSDYEKLFKMKQDDWLNACDEIDRLEALLHIKDVQETLGGESVLLDDVNDALAKADEIRGGE